MKSKQLREISLVEQKAYTGKLNALIVLLFKSKYIPYVLLDFIVTNYSKFKLSRVEKSLQIENSLKQANLRSAM